MKLRPVLFEFDVPNLRSERQDETWKNVRPPLVIMECEILQKLFATFDLIGYQIPE